MMDSRVVRLLSQYDHLREVLADVADNSSEITLYLGQLGDACLGLSGEERNPYGENGLKLRVQTCVPELGQGEANL
jgi:hypothetical protein